MPELPSLETVSPDDFRRIRQVFESALSRPESERRAYVVQACGPDTLVLREVERMLAAEAEPDGLFDRGDPAGTPRLHEGLGTQCSSCHAMLGATDRFCRACGTPARALQGDEGRFRAGALFASRFRIIARLGRGGMGEVYRADDLELGQPVALKFLRGPASAGHHAQAVEFDARARARLRSEVRLARQLAHPNVCRVYDIGEAYGELYLSMEYVDGEDLAALLKRIGRVPIDKGIEIARKLCAGLAAAHAKGVLHRDFKPANIMIDSHGEVRIMDFGLAAIADQLDTNDARSGTPAYMAPEQLAGKEATRQSDVYALGLVLYELFTGKPPFAGRDIQELQRIAWTGDYGSRVSVPVHVEAGAFQGRPVYFEVLFPWTTGGRESQERAVSTSSQYPTLIYIFVGFFLFFGVGVVLARHNWKTGRADVRGAALVGVATFAILLLSLILGAHDMLAYNPFFLPLAEGVGAAILYMAFEPWVRRLWPRALITWSRVLAGQWRDPVVGRDVLIAVLGAVAINCVRHALYVGFSPAGASAASSVIEPSGWRFTLDQLMGTRFIGSAGAIALYAGLLSALRMVFLMFLCRVCLRRPWLATLAYMGLAMPLAGAASFSQGDWIGSIVMVLIVVLIVLMMVRLGLLALAVFGAVGAFLDFGLLTNDFGAWYGESSLVVMVVVGALALWAFRTSLGGQPLFSAHPLKA